MRARSLMRAASRVLSSVPPSVLQPVATGFATQLDGTSRYVERYGNEISLYFQDAMGGGEIRRDGSNRISRPLP
jgi:hypothetical protein